MSCLDFYQTVFWASIKFLVVFSVQVWYICLNLIDFSKKSTFKAKKLFAKGRLSLFNLFIDMRTTVSLSISCGKIGFCWKISTKTWFFYMIWTN